MTIIRTRRQSPWWEKLPIDDSNWFHPIAIVYPIQAFHFVLPKGLSEYFSLFEEKSFSWSKILKNICKAIPAFIIFLFLECLAWDITMYLSGVWFQVCPPRARPRGPPVNALWGCVLVPLCVPAFPVWTQVLLGITASAFESRLCPETPPRLFVFDDRLVYLGQEILFIHLSSTLFLSMVILIKQ